MSTIASQQESLLSFEHFLWRAFTRRKLRGLTICLLIWALSVGAWMAWPRTYGADALILISTDRVNNDPGVGLDYSSFTNTQVELLQSDKIVEAAIARVGQEKLFGKEEDPAPTIPVGLPAVCTKANWSTLTSGQTVVSMASSLLARPKSPEALKNNVKKSISTEIKSRSNLVRVTFEHRNAEIAAEFVNALVGAYLEEYKQLYADTATAAFLDRQIQDANDRLATAQQGLAKFSTENQIYSLSVQQEALLARSSQLSNSVADLKADLAQKTQEQTSVESQLAQLRPHIMTSGQLGGLSIEEIKQTSLSSEQSTLSKDAPILLVKVYQDTAELIITRTMERKGLTASLQQQASELDVVQQKLNIVAQKAAQFDVLTQAVTDLKADLTRLLEKAREEKLRTAMSIRDLSTVRVAQKASPSSIPAGPSILILITALVGGLMLSGLVNMVSEIRAPNK
jgi:uncharacterized protein involved in exopolysaccharide biosynthesis